jgi:basic membrane protein A
MQKKIYLVLSVLILASMALAACGGGGAAPAATEAPTFKACQVTDTGGIDDKSFNATAWKGVQDAMDQLGIQGTYLESQE